MLLWCCSLQLSHRRSGFEEWGGALFNYCRHWAAVLGSLTEVAHTEFFSSALELVPSVFPDCNNDPWEMFSHISWRATRSCWGALGLSQSQRPCTGLWSVFHYSLGRLLKISFLFICCQTGRNWSIHFPPSLASESQYSYMTSFGFVISVDLLITAQGSSCPRRHKAQPGCI